MWPTKPSGIWSLLPSPFLHMPCSPHHRGSVTLGFHQELKTPGSLLCCVAFSLAGFPAWILQTRLLFFIQTSVSLPHWWTRPSKAFLPSSNVILWQNIAFFISFIVTKGFCNSFACSLIWILHKNGSFQKQELCPSQSALSGIETATKWASNKYLLNEWTSNQSAWIDALI